MYFLADLLRSTRSNASSLPLLKALQSARPSVQGMQSTDIALMVDLDLGPQMHTYPHTQHAITTSNIDRAVVSLFQTPLLRGMARYLPERFNEVIGVQHIKALVCDDDVLITGYDALC
jgi:hypothetical protein